MAASLGFPLGKAIYWRWDIVLFYFCGYNLFINTDLVYRVVNMPTYFLYPFQYGMFSNSILANLFDVGQMIQ